MRTSSSAREGESETHQRTRPSSRSQLARLDHPRAHDLERDAAERRDGRRDANCDAEGEARELVGGGGGGERRSERERDEPKSIIL